MLEMGMARDGRSGAARGGLSLPRRTVARLRANAVRVVGGLNPSAAVNDVILEAANADVRYRNGMTLPASAERLLADARRKRARHSTVLARNLQAAGIGRPKEVAAHHIVAHGDSRAFPSQELLFGWGIAINDADNGVYLPRSRRSVAADMPHAVKHAELHTGLYHLEVHTRLVDIDPDPAHVQAGREALRGIKAQLLDGTFPYRSGEEP
jgi:hypothetical protein